MTVASSTVNRISPTGIPHRIMNSEEQGKRQDDLANDVTATKIVTVTNFQNAHFAQKYLNCHAAAQ